MKNKILRLEKTFISITPTIDMQTCNQLGGFYKNGACICIGISEEDQQKLPKNIDYEKVANDAYNHALQQQILTHKQEVSLV